MNPLFTCPPPTALATIPTQACPFRYEQIVRFMIQRKQASPSFTPTSILLAATWTPLFAAAAGTKVVKTPLIPGVVIAPGEIIKEGGNDNTTINGIPRVSAIGFVPVTAQLNDASPDVIAALQGLLSESAINPGFTNLWAYFVNRFGQVIGKLNSGNVEGFPIYNATAGSTGTEGFGKPNVNNFSFDLEPGWDSGAAIYKPTDIDLLTA